jgi:cyclopropane-fatty-acyl-phospholipid synthase
MKPIKDDEAAQLEYAAARAERAAANSSKAESATAAPSEQSLEGRLLRQVLASLDDPPIRVTLWNGEEVFTSAHPPIARARIHDRAALLKLLINPDLHFGEGYGAGKIDIDGDLVGFLETIYRGATGSAFLTSMGQRLSQLIHRARTNSLTGSRENIHRHYDLGNDFYALWLGDTMAYTCAYFPTAAATLDEAQTAKMQHVCRKLRLRPGESVVEAGCGWGTFAIHMARECGVKVTAFNISHEQVAYARERAKREGLAERVEYVEDDYRNISGKYDAFVSIGMLEHVGKDHYHELGHVVSRSLRANGRGLIHSIGRNRPRPMNAWIERRIFPGAYPPSLKEMMDIFEPCNFSVLDVENIRLHYSKTLEHWLALFENTKDKIAQMFDENFVRMWRLYLAGSIAAFNVGDLQLFQILFAPPTNNDVPWTREHLYRN